MKLKHLMSVFALFTLAIIFGIGDNQAFAGTDATFGNTTTGPLFTVNKWMTGSMGKLFALGALGVGLGVGIVKQSVMAVAVGVGISLAASTGPAVLTSMFSAVI